MKKQVNILICLFTILQFFISGCSLWQPVSKNMVSPVSTPLPSLSPEQRLEWQRIERALEEAVSGREDVLVYLIYQVRVDRIEFSPDEMQALVWLALYEPETGELVPSEPGLALAAKNEVPDTQTNPWQITLQSDPDWAERLSQVPDSMLAKGLRDRYQSNLQKQPKEHLVFSGYRLPWKGGEARRVSGSIGHVYVYKSCPSTCLYAFDFADGTMFPVVAARSGRVKYAVWKYPNGNTENANYIVLEDTTTDPTTYQVYYHLAQDSIPAELRVPGAEVYQGQFLGNADDTGASTGHHLHFMVHTNANMYWATSVDITFDDVEINGGRPRTCAEAAQFPSLGSQCQSKNLFVSGNGDREKPTGVVTAPAADAVITQPVFTLTGKASDDTGIASIQVEITADGEWTQVGQPLTASPFSTQIDLCQAEIPDGNFFVRVAVKDTAGRVSDELSGLTRYVKSYDCNPKPKICVPEAGQVAVFADPNFQGACETLGLGDYREPGQLGEPGGDNIESIRLGQGVYAVMYDEHGFGGLPEIFTVSDNDLGDNPIGVNRVSSMQVIERPPLPGEPMLDQPLSQAGQPLTDLDEVTLTWQGGNQAVQFKSELLGPDNFQLTLDWQESKQWTVGRLAVGEYRWTVSGRNISGYSQASIRFEIKPVDLPPVTHLSVPNEEEGTTAILLSWQVDEGEDDLRSFDLQYRRGGKDWQDWLVNLPAYQRQAWYVGEPGAVVEFRLRATDAAGNQELYPPAAEVTVQIEAQCSNDGYEQARMDDDTISGANPVEPGENQVHNLCRPGDVDWAFFPAEAGKSYRIRTEPAGGNAAILAQLYSHDGLELLGEAYPAGFNSTSELVWIAPETGLYYVRLAGFDERLAGSTVRYRFSVEPIGQVFQTPLFCSGLALPVLWFLAKLYLKRKESKE